MGLKLRLRKKGGISVLRQKLGLSQEEFAQVLYITRSALNMHELGERSLADRAHVKISLLTMMLFKTEDFTCEEQHPREIKSSTDLLDEASAYHTKEKKCREQAAKIKKKVDSLEKIYKQTRHWLHIIELSLANESFIVPDEKAWWEMQKVMAMGKLLTCEKCIVLPLQIKIEVLLGKEKLYREARERLNVM